MKFSEIANRLTGISTPFGGASWQPAEMEIAGARRVIAFLEDRRVLYDPCQMEVPSWLPSEPLLVIYRESEMTIAPPGLEMLCLSRCCKLLILCLIM
jgi:hypothetical protein